MTDKTPEPTPPDRPRPRLPWATPKSGREDPAAPPLVAALLESPEYRQADADLDFLQSDETRGLRLHLDYLKADRALARHDVAHTIVVFGGTRVPEPEAARAALAALESERDRDPANAALPARIRIARRIVEKSRYYDVAREFGRLVGAAEAAAGGRLVVMTGGGPGMMEAANRGAHDVGALSVGLNIALPHEQYPNPYVTPGLCFSFHYFAIRKLHFLLRARALVVFPGGFGTMDELFETLTLIQTRKIAPLPVILVGEAYWRRAFDPEFLAEEGVIDPEDLELFRYAETAEEIWADILRWHERAGHPLTPARGAGA